MGKLIYDLMQNCLYYDQYRRNCNYPTGFVDSLLIQFEEYLPNSICADNRSQTPRYNFHVRRLFFSF
jgi:hypothetical protein